ncbi:MAG: GNAT family acetyltransferase [Spirochaetales bacterium]|nr:GNAT family acetyltransferase [Spirochaetales bacterium]
MEIRLYDDAKDRPGIVELWKSVFAYSDGRNEPNFSLDKKLALNDGLLLVAVEGETIGGSVMGGYDGHRGWIYSLAVAPELRMKRVGSRLLEEMEELLGDRGCVKINLQVVAENGAVQEFYEKSGYKREERISMGKVVERNLP